jgi:hypothetical protein
MEDVRQRMDGGHRTKDGRETQDQGCPKDTEYPKDTGCPEDAGPRTGDQGWLSGRSPDLAKSKE